MITIVGGEGARVGGGGRRSELGGGCSSSTSVSGFILLRNWNAAARSPPFVFVDEIFRGLIAPDGKIHFAFSAT